MLNQSNILVCSDFSACSNLAIKAANVICRSTKGKMSVLNVIDYPTLDSWKAYESLTYSVGEALKKELLNHATLSMKQQLKGCESEASSEISFGSPEKVILDKIKKDHIDLLVIGYRGNNPANSQLGNLTAKIVSASAIPVLVVKTPFEIKKVAGLVDPVSEKSDIVSWVEGLGYFLSTPLTIIALYSDHLGRFIGENTNKEKIFSEIMSLSDDMKKETVHRIDKEIHKYFNRYPDTQVIIRSNIETNLAEHLNSILVEEGIDTIVMQKHKPNLFKKLFIGSETRKMLDLFEGNLFILP